MHASEAQRAVAAARSTASALDLTVDDAIVLQDSNRLVLRLMPCDVVARVAPMEFQASAEFEVELAQRLAETESPVAALDPRVEPRVHVRDGFVMNLWTYYEPVPPRGPASRLRARARAPACRHAADRNHDTALHRSSRGGSTPGREPGSHSGARRRGPGASQQHPAKPEAGDRRPRCRRTAAARRAAPRERARRRRRGWCSSTSRRVAVGLSNSTSPTCPKR